MKEDVGDMSALRSEADVRSFREVSIVVTQIQEDIAELKESQRRLTHLALGSILCPMVVGVVIGLLFS